MAVACNPDDFEELRQQLIDYSCLYGAFGIHPEYAHQTQEIEKLKEFLVSSHAVAVGECGLDYHEAEATHEQQQTLFQQQIDLAHELHLPLMIHARDAEGDVRMMLKQAYQNGKLSDGFVLHCFSGSLDMAKEAVKMGGYLSATGVITFKNADRVRAVFAEIPLENLLVETDAPYLAPHPLRGQQNEPAYVQHTLVKLAEIKGISVSEMEQITTNNFKRLYKRGNQ
jgi:TatD DNase family protein